MRDESDFRFRLLEGDAGPQPRLEAEVLARTLGVGAIQYHGFVEVGPELEEPLRHDADEGGGNAVEDEGLADEARVGAEPPRPHLVVHDEDGRRAGLRVVRRERAAQRGGHAQEVEHVAGDEAAVELLGALGGRVDLVLERARDDFFKRLDLRLVVEELRELEVPAPARARPGRIVDLDLHQAVDVGVHRVRVHQDVLDDAEHRGGGADAQGQGQDGERREGRLLAESPGRVADVLPDGVHTIETPQALGKLRCAFQASSAPLSSAFRSLMPTPGPVGTVILPSLTVMAGSSQLP